MPQWLLTLREEQGFWLLQGGVLPHLLNPDTLNLRKTLTWQAEYHA